MTTRREFISDASKGLLGLGAIPAPGQIPAIQRRATGTGLIYDPRPGPMRVLVSPSVCAAVQIARIGRSNPWPEVAFSFGGTG